MPSDDADVAADLSGTERAVLGIATRSAAHDLFDGYARRHLGSGIARVRFRSGRIDAVWGVGLEDGRAVVLRAHRPPADVEALRTTRDAQHALAEAGFPAPLPLSGPNEVGDHVLTAEALLEGEAPSGREPGMRTLLAAGLARTVDLLRRRPDLLDRAGAGPSWCRYRDGPWPEPHDPIVDLRTTPPEYAWLDRLAERASAQILDAHTGADVVVGHADWYAGNVLVRGGRLTGVLDWDLVADTEAVVAGFAAAGYATSPTGGGGLSAPEEARGFLEDYATARGTPFTDRESRAALGASAWIAAFNARWQVGLLHLGIADTETIDVARRWARLLRR